MEGIVDALRAIEDREVRRVGLDGVHRDVGCFADDSCENCLGLDSSPESALIEARGSCVDNGRRTILDNMIVGG